MTDLSGSAEPAYLQTGTRLKNRYEIVREIGRGGYSVVYLARDHELDSDVAVKLLVPPPAMARVARERMRREVKVVRSLSHANIVAIHDFLEEGAWSFVVMEYVAGPDLSVQIRNHGPLFLDEVVHLGQGVAAGLSAAHRRGILHRDVKPQNILLDPDGRARLADFGSARLEGQATMTQTGGIVGTLNYTAPEVLAGQRGDARTDIYALGITLYFALTGSLPSRPSPHLPPPPARDGYHPRSLRPELPLWLDTVVARATAADPADRYPSAGALSDALAQTGPVLPVTRGSDLGPLGTCLLCNAPEPLNLGVCPRCGGMASGVADTLLFVHRQGAWERKQVRERLGAMLGTRVDPGQLDEAAAGHRALIRLPAGSAPRVLERLAAAEVPARATAARRAWVSVPLHFYGLMGAMTYAGASAGLVVWAPLVWFSPLLAFLWLLLAQLELQRPAVVIPKRIPKLPAELESELIEAFAQLPAGTARTLLADIVRMGQSLFPRLERGGGRGEVIAQLAILMKQAGEAARDLADLDDNLSRFSSRQEHGADPGPAWHEALAQCERVRDSLVQGLLDVIVTLGETRSRAASSPESAGAALAELVSEIDRHVKAHDAAAREVAALLAAPTSPLAISAV